MKVQVIQEHAYTGGLSGGSVENKEVTVLFPDSGGIFFTVSNLNSRCIGEVGKDYHHHSGTELGEMEIGDRLGHELMGAILAETEVRERINGLSKGLSLPLEPQKEEKGE